MREPSFKLVRSKRRTIALVVTADATLTVRAPIKTPLATIERIVRLRRKWIKRAIARMKNRPQTVPHNYTEGEQFPYLGDYYGFSLREGVKKKLDFQNGFILNAKYQPKARELMVAWYKEEAKRIISERVKWYAERAGLTHKSINITSAERRWGSCSPSGNLNFSFRIVMTPLSAIDYAVVHELAHLTHKNHGKMFWRSVEKMFSGYAAERKWLRRHGGEFGI